MYIASGCRSCSARSRRARCRDALVLPLQTSTADLRTSHHAVESRTATGDDAVAVWRPTDAMLQPAAMRLIRRLTGLKKVCASPHSKLSAAAMRRVRLRKPPSGKLGIGLRKRSVSEAFCTVYKFESVGKDGRSGPAERSGRVLLNDLVLSVGSLCVGGMDLPHVVDRIRSESPVCVLGLCRPTVMNGCRVFSVTLQFHLGAKSLGIHFVPVYFHMNDRKAMVQCLVVAGIVSHPHLNDKPSRGT